VILLLGGTTEALPIARALVAEGHPVLLSTATDLVPRGRFPEAVERVTGMLDEDQIAELISRRGVKALVDATHPYAAVVSENAWRACERKKIPYLAYERPPGVKDGPDIHRVRDHEEGAAVAFSFGRPVLLTIGIRNLLPYITEARRSDVKLVARVLDFPESLDACRKEGLGAGEIVCANGPFTALQNLSLLRGHGIGVLVTKDSGDAGGVGSKIAAAREAGCRVVVVDRPGRPGPGYETIPDLMGALHDFIV
jgi:precorrin-6A/cobalt-precorrin-6A reductase